MQPLNVLVTGATGFVGAALLQYLKGHDDFNPIGAVRADIKKHYADDIERVNIGNISAKTDWSHALQGTNVIVHTAGRAHILKESSDNALAEFRAINVEGTLNLAKQAITAGVSRFVFISSIKVNGEETLPNQPFSEDILKPPIDAYGLSKYEAECALYALAKNTTMDVVIIRPPLVYGPGVKANFLNLMKGLHKGLPLPLGAVHNFRSLVAIENLVNFIAVCITNPSAANQTFVVSDGNDLSTTKLLVLLGRALGRPARLLPIPTSWLYFAAGLMGKKSVAQRLCGNLQVDIRKATKVLNWCPPVTVEAALQNTASSFLTLKVK
ncbi:MAG: SDR family oxidoreductase [Pseudomonadota bacterium]